MIIGTFWSQKDNKWVRFVQEDGLVRAESASAREDNPSLAGEWSPEGEGIWSVNYSLGEEAPLRNEFYRVQDGILYHDTGITRYGVKIIEHYLPSGWGRYPESMKAKYNPFSTVQGQAVELLAYEHLPLTVEIQEERREEEERLAEEAREAARQKWAEIKKGDFFGQFIASVESAFTPEQNDYLYHELSKELLPFPISAYETPVDFIELWSQELEDREGFIRNAIIKVASTTFLDEDFALNPQKDDETRRWLFERKKAFCLAVINAGIGFVRDTFDLAGPEQLEEQIPLDVQVPVLDAQVKISVGQSIYKFFSGLLAGITQYVPNIFNWSKPARTEEMTGDDRPEQHERVVVIDHSIQEERSLGAASSQESWLSRKKAGELVQSSMSYVSSLRSLFWSTPQTTDTTQEHAPTQDGDQPRVEQRL
ncbi:MULTISPECIES: hypothetical protein [unclassified Legionella]|uniref:hypothetical protein n=1 Tax=unclassified Legionella TaxID=2622702 RepID=UPI001E2C493A|nr:hypothetical protein [Legionella sp. 31fI33]MCC5014793.1 hypothetical protein [Legionella sp. 31fI33]